AAALQATTVLSVFRPGNTALATDTALLAASLTLARSADSWNGASVPVVFPGQPGPSAVEAVLAGAPAGLAPESAPGMACWGATADACFTDDDWMQDLRQNLRDRSGSRAEQSADSPAEGPEVGGPAARGASETSD